MYYVTTTPYYSSKGLRRRGKPVSESETTLATTLVCCRGPWYSTYQVPRGTYNNLRGTTRGMALSACHLLCKLFFSSNSANTNAADLTIVVLLWIGNKRERAYLYSSMVLLRQALWSECRRLKAFPTTPLHGFTASRQCFLDPWGALLVLLSSDLGRPPLLLSPVLASPPPGCPGPAGILGPTAPRIHRLVRASPTLRGNATRRARLRLRKRTCATAGASSETSHARGGHIRTEVGGTTRTGHPQHR